MADDSSHDTMSQSHPTTSATDAPDVTGNDNVAFVSAWNESDADHFRPSNLPLRRVQRGWERKAQSPLLKHRFARKIWTRHAPVRTVSHDQQMRKSQCSAHPDVPTGSLVRSPTKIVKKRCLSTSFGHNATVSHWDLKSSTPLRKKPFRRFSTSPHFTHDPNSYSHLLQVPSQSGQHVLQDEEESENVDQKADDDTQDDDEEEDGWLDVSSEDELEDTTRGALEENETLIGKPPVGFASPGQDCGTSELVPDIANTTNGTPLKLEQHDSQSTISHIPIPPARSSSAPPEDLTPRETRLKPRISDDTAILQAFLNRAAASKRTTPSIAKRESLTNRRESDAVRQALASPAKNDVLADLDPNSPLPHKTHTTAVLAVSPDSSQDPAAVTILDSIDPVGETAVTRMESKPTRRSVRSRTRVSQMQSSTLAGVDAKVPNKITIRSAADQIALTRTEAQELALLTRNNTRKNKGASVMPVAKLLKLADDFRKSEPLELNEEVAELLQSKRGIRWDETLVYYQEFQGELEASASDDSQHDNEASATLGDATIAATPIKARSRRLRLTSRSAPQSSTVSEAAAGITSQVPAENGPVIDASKPDNVTSQPAENPRTPAQKKPKSRIATPAKGLLSTASLLSADLLPTPSSSNETSMSAKDTSKKTPAIPRVASAPRKLNLDLPRSMEGKENNSLATPKNSGISSFRTASVPKLESSKTKISVVIPPPGLLSPAKKPVRSGSLRSGGDGHAELAATSAREQEVPGLASPAKKRTKARIL